ncbi:SDR family oxidoreductase [Flavobacterium paronense]|uniref:SDR family NAD(P)-dependent oxidoreductase n=1 Tax=Flavobacterium paronense TaxID=1392775 RepID=A0ABV5GBK4_9FLAO|nr:SDR family oxidoreductase [Flavobacterium paronense]MDN3676691.1 SDR family oxidoreductase [Flavobacterium paronense]
MKYNPFSLSGKFILVTGASSGIGKVVALECSKMGANVIITGRNKERLNETFQSLEKNENHLLIVADLSNKENLDSLVLQIPKLDGIVHCAAMLKKVPFKFLNEKSWAETIETNLYAPAILSQLLFKNNKINLNASIVFISSIASKVASFGNISYMASKGAINSLSRGMALELAPKKIRVNTIEPALIKTNLIGSIFSDEDLENYLKKFPLGRFGEPEEVAYAVIYLLSDATSWITGTIITIDGGVTLR